MNEYLMQSDTYLAVLIIVSLALNIVALIQISNLKYKLKHDKKPEEKNGSVKQ